MQARDDSAVLASCQQGSLLAWQQLVHLRQDELLRTAFLLTGDADDATTLAATAFLDLFRALPRSNPDRDSREWLLELQGRDYLAGRIAADRLPDPLPISSYSSALVADQRQHFQVDDERTRIQAALGRLERPARIALVLTEFSGLEQQLVAKITGQSLAEVRRELERSRKRLAEAAGQENRQLRGVLSSVATGAPRVDLWPLLEEPLEQIEAGNQRRSRILVASAAVLAGLVLLLGLGWLIGGDPFDDGNADSSASEPGPVVTVANSPALAPTAIPDESSLELVPTLPSALSSFVTGVGEVPELQIVTNTQYFQFANVFSGLATTRVIDPANETNASLENANSAVGVSPDGRWVLFHGITWNEEHPEGITDLAAYDTHSGKIAWQRTFTDSFWASVALTPEQAYVSSPEGEIFAFNLRTGTETGRWSILESEQEEPGIRTNEGQIHQELARLYIDPNQRQLYAFISTEDSGSSTWTRTKNIYLLPGMTLVSTQSFSMEVSRETQWLVDFNFWNSRPTVDGNGLYNLTQTVNDGYAVRFLDLVSNELDEVVLPIDTQGGRLIPHVVHSNSGQLLYVLSGDGKRVAIIDLLNRRLLRVNPIDYGPVGPLIMPANLYERPGGYAPWMSSLAINGKRLYLAIPTDLHEPMERTTVLIIDVATWQVIKRWDTEGRINHMAISSDGLRLNTLVVYPDSVVERGDVASDLVTFDPDGNTISEVAGVGLFPDADSTGITELHSLMEVYKRQYGFASAVGGVPPEDAPLNSTLPDVAINAAEPLIAAGNQAEIAVGFLDPASGEPLITGRPDVRFDPDAAVTITLSNPETRPVIIQPVLMADGSYRAVTELDVAGSWSATVTVTYGDSGSWSVQENQIVEVIQSIVATDHKRYYPRFFTIPEQPVTDELFTVGVEFRDIENNLPMSEDAELPGGMPDEIRVSFLVSFVRGDAGNASKTLERVEHARYEGQRAFRDPGQRRIVLDFNLGDERFTTGGGSIRVELAPDDS